MDPQLVDQLVDALLYEGYLLYPYRPTSIKNSRGFTFGRIYPQAYCVQQLRVEPFLLQSEVLVETTGLPRLAIEVRFLQPLNREVGVFGQGSDPLPIEWVRELRVNGRLYQSWQEATERSLQMPWQNVQTLCEKPFLLRFAYPSAETREPIADQAGQLIGVLARQQRQLEGEVTISAQKLRDDLFQITLRIMNESPLAPSAFNNEEELLLQTLAATHSILEIEGGQFISLLEPEPSYAEAAQACRQIGAWPVLIGDPAQGPPQTMLASPIILYDYPQLAPESPGDFFEGTEIEELLTLRILTMTEAEKSAIRQGDPRARHILERTEALSEAERWRLHGRMSEGPQRAVGARRQCLLANGRVIQIGDRVWIRPKGPADVMDLVLAGRIAIIEAIEEDAEARIYLALVLEEDPGQDLGRLEKPGHRFFYGPDEIQPLPEG